MDDGTIIGVTGSESLVKISARINKMSKILKKWECQENFCPHSLKALNSLMILIVFNKNFITIL